MRYEEPISIGLELVSKRAQNNYTRQFSDLYDTCMYHMYHPRCWPGGRRPFCDVTLLSLAPRARNESTFLSPFIADILFYSKDNIPYHWTYKGEFQASGSLFNFSFQLFLFWSQTLRRYKRANGLQKNTESFRKFFKKEQKIPELVSGFYSFRLSR